MAEFMAYIQTDEFINPTNKYKMIDELIAKGELYTSDELKEYRLAIKSSRSAMGYIIVFQKKSFMSLDVEFLCAFL